MTQETWKSVFDYGQYGFAILAAICAGLNIYFGKLIDENKAIEESKKEARAALQGKIELPKKDSTPVNPVNNGTVTGAVFGFGNNISKSKLDQLSKENVIVKIGSFHMETPKEYLLKGINFIQEFDLGTSSPVILKVSHGKLLVSAKFFDKKGKIICEIEDNEWTINPNNYFKKNDDKTALEVIDQEGHVALSVELFNESLIKIYGIFPGENKIKFAIENKLMELPSDSVSKKNCKKETGITWDEYYKKCATMVPEKFKYGKDSHGIRI